MKHKTFVMRRYMMFLVMSGWFAMALIVVAASTSTAEASANFHSQWPQLQQSRNVVLVRLTQQDPDSDQRACINEQVQRTKDSSTKNVLDLVDLLSDDERGALQKQADHYAKELKMSVSLLYTDDFCGLSPMVFADEFYEAAELGLGKDHSGVFMAVDTSGRQIWVSTEGEGINQLTDSEIDSINSDVAEELGDDDWSAGAQTYFDDIDVYCGKKKPLNPFLLYGISGIAGAGIGGVIGRGRANANAAKHETVIPSADALYYADMSTLEIAYANEVFTHSVQELNPAADKTTTHRSSSGRVHGGGGTSF